jgi:hypothetical protein
MNQKIHNQHGTKQSWRQIAVVDFPFVELLGNANQL